MVTPGALAAAFLLYPGTGGGVLVAPGGTAAPLTFGAYPGGGAGTVGPAGRTLPENRSERLAAIQRLRTPGRPFVLHIYASFTGPASPSPADQVGQDIAEYTAAGLQVELVLTYRPADRDAARNVPAFLEFARDAVRTFGSNPRFVALQVTNEANVRNAPNAADGAYAGAESALIQGVVTAKSEARRRGFSHVAIGFNWAYASGPAETAFWQRLGRSGDARFRRSVDWVGLDVYPGTWGPRIAGSNLKATTAKTMHESLGALRRRFMPLAGLPASVPIHLSETGYPTGRRRTEAMQVDVMRTSIAVVNANRSRYHVTDYRWFDLRDADSSNSSFESQYGLMRDDYTPKAAFGVYRKLVAAFGAA